MDSSPIRGSSFFLGKSDCLGCAVLFCLVCLFDSFFLPSHLSFKNIYCMKPPNIKAPKCTLFSRVKGRKGSTVLPRGPRLIASIVGGSLLRSAHYETLRAAEAKNAATINHLMSKRQSVLYFPYIFSRVKGRKVSPVLPRLLLSIAMGSLLRRAHLESLRAAEAKNSSTINQLKYRSCSCITANMARGCGREPIKDEAQCKAYIKR